jgi:hypothetical protein
LVRIGDTPVALSRKERSRDEHGNIVFDKVWQRGRHVMVRLRLVIVTRLHTQLSYFRLCISSNTPSYSEEG